MRGAHEGARLWDTFGLLGLRGEEKKTMIQRLSLSEENHFDLKDSGHHIKKKKKGRRLHKGIIGVERVEKV